VWAFFKQEKILTEVFKTDIHSHLLAGLDDGVRTWADALAIIETFQSIGLTGAITTPHIMSDTHPNTPVGILEKAHELQQLLHDQHIHFTVQAAAEYYYDEFTHQMAVSGESFLSFGNRYVLFETATYAEPMLLNEFVFQLKVKGYNPVMAHPERYQYLYKNLDRVEDLINRGVYMQVNALSFAGFYSKPIEKMAKQLLDNRMIHFLGSDCHTPQNARAFAAVIKNPGFQRALQLPLLNYSL
jgi:protein-tyrosine phosphatase